MQKLAKCIDHLNQWFLNFYPSRHISYIQKMLACTKIYFSMFIQIQAQVITIYLFTLFKLK